ncbi:MAG: glycosyltransferase [Bacteroidetes bacterium]|nr:glycosyltransferase [Bacteroidota bacterium]
MSDKNLVLITHHFPFGSGETFLESEVPWLVPKFNSVIVLTKNVESKNSRFHAPNFYTTRISPRSSWVEKIKSIVLFIKHGKKSIGCLLSEFRYLRGRNKKITFVIFKRMMHDVFKALVLAQKIENEIKLHRLAGTVVLYSYWFTSAALAMGLVSSKKVNIKRVTRAHGGDLYPELHPGNYLSYRQVSAQALDKIYPTSQVGATVLKNLISSSLHSKIEIAKLGTLKPGVIPVAKTSNEFIIVSVSSLKPIKRIHLIIEALSLLQHVPVHWVHYGDGSLREELEILAKKKLNHIRYEFRGAVSNSAIFDFYQKNYVDLFINVSASEGIPLSLMEAQSFGIPCIATNVGGNGEIVSAETGKLVSPEGTPQEIASAIRQRLSESPAEKEKLRQQVMNNWAAYYDSSKNYAIFSDHLLTL